MFRTQINDTLVGYANFINIAMPMYNLIEYSHNYSDTSENLWDFKRDEVANNANVVMTMLLHLNTKQALLMILK